MMTHFIEIQSAQACFHNLKSNKKFLIMSNTRHFRQKPDIECSSNKITLNKMECSTWLLRTERIDIEPAGDIEFNVT